MADADEPWKLVYSFNLYSFLTSLLFSLVIQAQSLIYYRMRNCPQFVQNTRILSSSGFISEIQICIHKILGLGQMTNEYSYTIRFWNWKIKKIVEIEIEHEKSWIFKKFQKLGNIPKWMGKSWLNQFVQTSPISDTQRTRISKLFRSKVKATIIIVKHKTNKKRLNQAPAVPAWELKGETRNKKLKSKQKWIANLVILNSGV